MSYDNPWYYQGNIFESEQIGDHVAFVYRITNECNGRMYIGQKKFVMRKTRQVNKKPKKYLAESDWKNYWSSGEELKADVAKIGKDSFKREIIRLCKRKAEANYYELWYQMTEHVLLSPLYYNSFAGTRINRSHLKHLLNTSA